MRKILLLCLFCFSLDSLSKERSQPLQGSLDNGLRYTLLPLYGEKGHIEIRLKVYAGSVDEADDQAGVAHMVEHLVFRASEQYPNGVMPYLHSQKWIRGKNYNAVTTNDHTTYMLTPPKNSDLKQSLEVLSQMVFHAKLNQSDLDNERKIILEEWRAGQGVAARMNRARTNVVRMDSRYTRHPVIGTEKSIKTMPVEQLQKFYKRWYLPNNMQLLVVGDLDIAQTELLIQRYFGSALAGTLPVRDYLEPKLSDALRTVQLQDEQSGSSQIAYIVRFDEHALREQTDAARYARLVDRLALSTVAQRLRSQQSTKDEGVRSVVIRKADIGHKTVALGMFAGVEANAHRQGLQRIFEEIERLKRFPITEDELNVQKATIAAQIVSAKQHSGERDFSAWVQVMSDTILNDKPYFTPPEIAALTEPMLQKITLSDINQRIQYWFSQSDRIVQYQAPRLTQIEPINADFVKNMQKNSASAEISAPQKAEVIAPMVLENLDIGEGNIQATTYFEKENVRYFTLSNGDKVVWLKSPIAAQKSYFEARSAAGFRLSGFDNWQAQLATQLIAQNAPLAWRTEQLNRWKSEKKVNLVMKQAADYLSHTATVENSALADLLRLYAAYNVETHIKEGLQEVKTQWLKQWGKQNSDSAEIRRLELLNRLRYGASKLDIVPNEQLLAGLTEQELNQIWAVLRAVPTTFYLVNDMSEEEVSSLITTYLAPINRQSLPKNMENAPLVPLGGREVVRFPLNLEPKDDVKIWFFSEQEWQGKDAVLVSLLKQIVTNKLKLTLRDEHLGVYSLHFESSLNPLRHRIESELSFSSDPKKTDELVKLAEQVLRSLADQINDEDVKVAKSAFLQAEKARLVMPHTWLNRLILSDTQFGSPRYISEAAHLADNITLEQMRLMAKRLYDENNVKVFITTPK